MCSMSWAYVISFFFFKQKTAYEMRISDWSSDVCSSDLLTAEPQRQEDRRDDQSEEDRQPAMRLADQGIPFHSYLLPRCQSIRASRSASAVRKRGQPAFAP